MRYYLRNRALIIRGNFRAASNGTKGGVSDVKTLLNATVPGNFSEDAGAFLDKISAQNGFLHPLFGLLTAVPMSNLCIARFDYITVFVTAAVSEKNRTINIIVTSARPLSDAALLGAMMTVTEAKMQVLIERKLPASAGPTDAIIVAFEKSGAAAEEFAGPLTETGDKISRAVHYALTEALIRFDNYLLTTWGVSRGWSKTTSPAIKQTRPAFFIYSRYGGDHWVEWAPEGCQYYPCHNFERQNCSFCYCPLYPCMDSEFGHSITTPNGELWSCMDCRFIHEPEVASHLLKNPEAGICELKAVWNREK